MKLATLKNGARDGQLVVVSRDLSRHLAVSAIAATLQQALDDWTRIAPRLQAEYQALNDGRRAGEPFDPAHCAAPLPRAYQWLDASAYLNHVDLTRRARGGEMPPSFLTDPLMYQGASDDFMGPRDPITAASEDLGVDLEAEIVVITNDVPLGVNADDALRHIVLLGLVNDVTLRNVVLPELAKGFGFLQGKPASALSPVLVTPDELQPYWRGGKLHRPMQVWLNDRLIGQPQAGEEMQFHFGELIAHAARAPPGRRHAAGQRHDLQRQRRGRRLLPGGSARARSCAMAKCARHSSSMATACGSACATMPARACSAISTRRWKFPPRGRCRPRPH